MMKAWLVFGFGLAFLLGDCVASEFLLHCQWACPNTREAQTLTFAKNPLVVVLPGQELRVTATRQEQPALVTVLKAGQPVSMDKALAFTAPEKAGAYYVRFRLDEGGRSEDREVCVLVPYKGAARKSTRGFDLVVDGEEVGNYRLPSASGNRKVRENPDSYQPPVWWLRITETNAPFEVVPGVRAEELVATTEETGMRHSDLVPVYYPMWKAIVSLRMALERRGIPGSALKLISMFRAPPYNRMVGSNAYGRHVYGDAFDFYINIDGTEKAADLNQDRKLNRQDAYPVVALIEDLQGDGKIPMGGIGVYNVQGGDHEVTMHLDMRGHRATWGYVTSPSGKKSEFSWQSRRFADLDRRDEDINAQRAASEGKPYIRPRREALP